MLGRISGLTCLLVCAYAIWRGKAAERTSAAACLLAFAAEAWLQDRVHWIDPERRLLAIDGTLLVVFASLFVQRRLRWLTAAAGAQLLAVAAHFMASASHRSFHALTYITVENGLNYIVLFALLWGSWQVQQRPRKPTEAN